MIRAGGDGAGIGEVLKGGVSVMGHGLLAGTEGGALSVAAVVDGEDVDADVVKGGEGGDVVGEGAVAVGEEEDGEVRVAAAGVGRDPPAGELGSGGVVGIEAEEFVGNACDGCGGC